MSGVTDMASDSSAQVQRLGKMRRVLIYRLGSLGDTIVALPALKLVARAFPEAERWVLTNFSASAKAAPMAAVLEGTGLVHGYIEYPLRLRSPRALLALRKRLRALDADTLVYLADPRGRVRAWRDALFFRACCIRRLIGVPYSAELQRSGLVHDDLYESKSARLARCITALGDARVDDPDAYDLTLDAYEHARAASVLAPLGDCSLIAVSVGTKVDVNDWEDARWRPLLARLAARYPEHGLVLLGSADERTRCEGLRADWGARVLNLCGALSVRESAAVMMRCQVFIGHDSGPMHLAAAVGTPCVAIFSSRNLPGEWFPHGQQHRVLYQPLPCQGCRLGVCVEKQKECIRSITVESVFASASGILAIAET